MKIEQGLQDHVALITLGRSERALWTRGGCDAERLFKCWSKMDQQARELLSAGYDVVLVQRPDGAGGFIVTDQYFAEK